MPYLTWSPKYTAGDRHDGFQMPPCVVRTEVGPIAADGPESPRHARCSVFKDRRRPSRVIPGRAQPAPRATTEYIGGIGVRRCPSASDPVAASSLTGWAAVS